MRHAQIESLISRVKTKDPVLYEILRNLNLDSRDTSQTVVEVEVTQGQQAVDLSTIEAEIDALQAAILLFATQADLDALAALFGNHKDRHASGGGDAFVATDLIDALIKRVRTVTADLVFGTVGDGKYLRRAGLTIIGDTPQFPFGYALEDPEEPQMIPGPRGIDGTSGTIGRDGITIPPRDPDDPEDPQVIPGERGPQGVAGAAGADSTVPGPAIVLEPDDPEPPQVIPGERGTAGAAGAAGQSIMGPPGPPGEDAEEPLMIPGPPAPPGSATAGGSDTEVQFNNAGVLDGASQIRYDNAGGRLLIGSDVTAVASQVEISSDSIADNGLTVSQHNDGVQGAKVEIKKSRNTGASPTQALTSDTVLEILIRAFGITDYVNAARIRAILREDAGSSNAPANLIFEISSSGEKLRLTPVGSVFLGGVMQPFATGSFTIPTAHAMIHSDRLILASTERATIQGSGRLRIT